MRIPGLFALAAAGLAAGAARAEWPAGRFGMSRMAGYVANPPEEAVDLRATRQFVDLLHPVDRQTIAYRGLKQMFGPREWVLDRQRGRLENLGGNSANRGIWYRFDMLEIPPTAHVDQATLRVYPRAHSLRDPEVPLPRATLSFEDWGVEMEFWTGPKRKWWKPTMVPDPGGVEPVLNGPVLEWDVSDYLRRAHSQESLHRQFQLVIKNLDYPGRPWPVLAVTYRIASVANVP